MKLKIHYLEEALRKSGTGFNQAALKENTELKVIRVTMQRELQRCKKSLQQAEQDIEGYRLQLGQFSEKANRRHTDEQMQKEMNWLREKLEVKESLVKKLQEELNKAKEKESDKISKLRDEINELEFTVREKDRLIEGKEEKIASLKGREGHEIEKLRDEISDQVNFRQLRIHVR